uniref:TrmO C-terminal domain-containing protein n=1 Tax=Lotharella oceanica TaxID=641309 RepID=A0A7S2X9L5_9EUKA|mmetsp:Transcript_20652/g.38854  ORF Transcript_20652/g.38854 Transcript_20652/m.38854 type:complete len:133 (+) Transcript_20652:308-706(+)
MQVTFSQGALKALEGRPPHEKAVIEQALAQDPRPAFHKSKSKNKKSNNHDHKSDQKSTVRDTNDAAYNAPAPPSRSYAVRLFDWNVHFVVHDEAKVIVVTNLEQVTTSTDAAADDDDADSLKKTRKSESSNS